MNSIQLRKMLHDTERSQRYLARKLKVSYQSMYKWVNGYMPISDVRAKQIKEILKLAMGGLRYIEKYLKMIG